MERKFFFFDIDGTLTDIKTGEIVPSAIEAIKKLQEKNHFVAIATGRAHYKCETILNDLGLKNMVANGGNSLTINSKLIVNHPLDKQLALSFIEELERSKIGYLVSLDNSINVYSKNHLFIEQMGLRKEPTRYIIDNNLNLNEKDIYKIYVAINQNEDKNYPIIKKLGYIRFINDYLIIQPDNKALGIKEMIKILNGNINNVVVFGDDVNDIVMFKEPWYKVAMGNGNPKLKELADFVCDSNVNDGIYKACKIHGWID